LLGVLFLNVSSKRYIRGGSASSLFKYFFIASAF